MKDDNSLLKGYTSNLIRDGIEVIEELKWPFNDEPFISTNFVINILKTGYLDMEYDSKPYKCGPKLASIIFPGHIFTNHKFSDDYSATAIVVNKAVFEKMRLHDVYLNRFKYDEVPHFQLTDSQYEDILKVFATAGIINKLNIEAKNDMLIAALEIIIHMIDHYRTLNEPKPTSGNKRISSELYEIICKNCRKHHDVEFYAEQFHLSPKHFSTVIKKETGYRWALDSPVCHGRRQNASKDRVDYKPASHKRKAGLPRPAYIQPLFQEGDWNVTFGISQKITKKRATDCCSFFH